MTMIKKRIIWISLCIIGLLMSSISIAQEGEGQICVRAFEDRNSNGTFDANEPLITQGVGVNLMNALGVTIDSKLLGDSSTSAQGVVCFQQLLIGDYMVVVTSADYSAVTSTTFNASVVPGSVPVRFDFGGQVISTATDSISTDSSAVPQADRDQAIQGILFGLIGAVVVMGIMVIAGMVIYFGVFRRRMNRVMLQGTGGFRPVTGPMPAYNPGTGPMPAYSSPPSTGSMPAVEPHNPLLNRDPNEGSPPLFSDEDTDQMGSV